MARGERAQDQTLLGISMSKDLKARIKAAADKEKRPMANWCAFHLERLLNEMDSTQHAEEQDRPAIETPAKESLRPLPSQVGERRAVK